MAASKREVSRRRTPYKKPPKDDADARARARARAADVAYGDFGAFAAGNGKAGDR